MKDIIKSIEDAQLKPEVDSFRVGDTGVILFFFILLSSLELYS